jgi:hypothetical protein
MAESDYNVADRVITSLEAGDKVQETVQATPDQDARDFAAAGGVSSAAYRNYATALTSPVRTLSLWLTVVLVRTVPRSPQQTSCVQMFPTPHLPLVA